MVKLKIAQESSIDDTQTIIQDVRELQSRYIGIIDKLRSISKPANLGTNITSKRDNQQSLVTSNNFENIEINATRPLESRTHCFYRMLGFPVVGPDGSFYSPGFEPNSTENIDKKEKINQSIKNNQSLIALMNMREVEVQTRRNVFVRQDSNSTAYALVSRYIRSFSGYFNQDTMGVDPLAIDPQRYTIKDRVIALANFQGNSNDFKDATHILRPFIVNPLISDTVLPAENMICVPFLPNKEATRIDVNKSLFRPGIEQICRSRLKQDTEKATIFLNEARRLINGDVANDESDQNIRNTILAITGVNDLGVLKGNTTFFNTISKFNNTQFQTINTLIKTIKKVVIELDQAIRTFDTINTRINFQPIPNADGMEFGGSIRISGGKSLSDYDQKISVLKVLSLNAQMQQKKTSDNLGGGNELFACVVVDVAQRNYEEEIAKLQRERDELANTGTEALAIIEMITGEVSGLGLLDVLAIYTALWSINIDQLIGFLDDAAFDRLYKYNPELKTPEVEARNGGAKLNGLDVLKAFEVRLFNIFSFVDKLIEQARNSPIENSGGDI